MKLLIQPGDGVASLVKGIAAAKRSVEIVIFRFNQKEIEKALANAVNRGVAVHALIAHTNRAGEENLRQLEMRLLAQGVIVARTADDLVRYHGKLMIIDRRYLYLLAFNLTYADIEQSRSFGVITSIRDLVREAVKLFEADTQRHRYEPGLDRFVVSPANARKQLSSFIKGAKKQLIIYDPKVSDPSMIRLLEERSKAGVDIKIIGRLTQKSHRLAVHGMPQIRLHTRTMVRDGQLAFVGSQSLRELELDARREVGIIFRDLRVVNRLVQTFQDDWALAERPGEESEKDLTPVVKVAKKVAKVITKELPPLAPVLDVAVKELVGPEADLELDPKEVEEMVKGAVKQVVKEVVKEVVEEAVAQNGGRRI